VIASLVAATLAATPAVGVSDGRYLMGTVLEIRLPDESRAGGRELLDALFARVAALEHELSSFETASALSRLNGAAGAGPQPVPPDLARLLELSLACRDETLGAFDVTVGPLVALWGEAGARGELPDAAALALARARVGDGKLRVAGGRAELSSGARVELGGIGKGFALDALVRELGERGVERALLDFGGSSLHAIGAPPGEPGWRVLVRDAASGFAGIATLRDQALSVSGSFGRSSRIGGRRFGHVVDPRSGWPLERAGVSAVVADSGARAEALSKALLVLGPDEGIALLEARGGAEGLLVDESGRRFQTRGFARAVRFAPLAPAPLSRSYPSANWSSASSR
jgi:thiamine biosynthesis lipoprotein